MPSFGDNLFNQFILGVLKVKYPVKLEDDFVHFSGYIDVP